MTVKYFNVKNGLTTGNISLDASNSNITANTFIGNLSVTQTANLGNISNVIITGGSNGYFLQTDGTGNLSFRSSASTQSPAPMPYYIPSTDVLTIAANYQGLFTVPITIDGALIVDGILAQVDGIINIDNNEVVFYDGNITTGSNNFTYNNTTSTLAVTKFTTTSANLGAVANFKVTGGSAGQYLQTDGTGNLVWAAGGATPGGTNTQVQFNDNNSLGGNSGFTFDKTTGTLAAPLISGAGNALSNIQGANVSGAVGLATFATTANSVAGANVTGAVGLATFATTANAVAGANVSGAVAYATTANAVAGANVSGQVNYAAVANSVAGANVSGAVGLATFATTANAVAGANVVGSVYLADSATSVAGANVTGQVNYAVTANNVAGANVSGQVNYAATANAVAGANVSGTVASATNAYSVNGSNVSGPVAYATTANSVAGANVSGAVGLATFATTANAVAGANVSGQVANALVAGTVTTNAQPNITSTGTLASLSVSGNANIGNIGTGIITATGNITGSNIATGGNVSATGNIIANTKILVGDGATVTGFSNPVFLAKLSGAEYLQAALINANNTASADWVAYGDNGNDVSGWADMGFTGSNYSDANFTITGKNDGYFFVEAVNGAGLGGNLVLATGSEGSTNDIIFATGGFSTTNEIMRLKDAEQQLSIKPTTPATTTTTGALVVSGGIGVAGNIIGGGIISTTGNITAGNINAGNLLTVNNLSVTTYVTSNLIPNANITYNLGSSTNRWKDLWLSNSTLYFDTDSTMAAGTVTNGNSSLSIPQANGNVNINSAGVANVLVVTGTGVNVSGTLNTGSGVITGNGSGLISLTGANVTGQVNYANTSNNVAGANVSGQVNYAATANAVAGANVTGAVAYATTANAVAGANVSGQVSFAATANSVAGANVSGAVGLATFATTSNSVAGANVSGAVAFATTANSVAVANVSGIGNIAVINLDGNASNILYGNGVFANAPSGATYGNSNVATFLASYGSNTITTTGNVSVGNIIGNGASLSSITGANVTGAVSYATTANAVAGANVSGQVANALVAGTVTTNAQPNITSTGTLASLSVTGNATAGNLLTGGILNVTGTGVSSVSGNLNMNSNYVVSLSDPVNPQDAATKAYVDAAVTGLNIHPAANAATTVTLATATSGTMTYNNGASGVGANLVTTGSYVLIDGYNVATVGSRILVKNETNAAWNGVYTYANSSTIVRATDMNNSIDLAAGDFVFVNDGTVNAGTGWVQTSYDVIIGTTPVVFTQFSGAGTYSAGTGLTLTGTVFSVNDSQTQVTAVGTLASLSVSGNANIGNIGANNAVFTTVSGNGSALSSITGANVTGAVAFATTANAVAGANVSGAVGFATTANSVAGANVSGQVNFAATANSVAGANVSGAVGLATFATTANSVAVANVSGIGNISTLNLTGSSTNVLYGNGVFAPISGYGNSDVATFLASYGSNTITTTGNVSVGNIIGNGQSLTSITGANVSGQVNYAATANAVAGANVSGAVAYATTANSVAGSNVTGSVAFATTANAVAGANVSGEVSYAAVANSVAGANVSGAVGLATFATTANAVAGANVSGAVAYATTANAVAGANVSGQVANSLIAGTVYTNAQPNITSTGTLVSLSVSGNADVGNLNTAGQLVSTVATGTAPLVVTSTTTVANLTAAVATVAGTVTAAAQGNITGLGILNSLSVSGNANVGNIGTTGQFVSSIATGTSPLVVTSTTEVANLNAATAGLATFATTANAVAGANVSGQVANSLIAGTVYTNAQPNITSTGTLVSLSVSGNADVGNIIGPLANGNSNIAITSNGNINMTVGGVANIVTLTTTAANVAGILNVTGNISANGAILSRVVSVADGTSVTINGDTTDLATQTNTQVTGTLTINSPSGTPYNGQKLVFRLQSSNVQTFSWNTVFAGSTDLSLPTVSSGSSKYDYVGFIYNTPAVKWQLLAKNFGF